MRKLLIPLLMLCFLPALVQASFEVTVKPLKDTIALNDRASFALIIRNEQGFDDRFRIYYTEVQWDVATDPLTDSTLAVDDEEEHATTLIVKPRSGLVEEDRLYLVPVTIKSVKTGEIQRATLSVSVLSESRLTEVYSPVIRGTIEMPLELDPRETFQVDVNIRNLNPREYENIEVSLDSELIKETKRIPLKALEEKTVSFKIKLPDAQAPQKDYLAAYVAINNLSRIKLDHTQYEVAEYGGVQPQLAVEKKFFRTAQTITLVNTGNAERRDTYRHEAPFFRLFTRTDPKATVIKEDSETYYGWDYRLRPQQSLVVTIHTDYRMLLYLIVAIALGILLYYWLRSPLVIVKSASGVVMREGGISEMKLLIVLKNRSHSSLEDIRVTDRVPHIAEVKDEFQVGTLAQSGIVKHQQHGTLVHWNLDGLESFEERLLSYTIKSKFSILGVFKLPIAKATFLVNGRKRKTTSNVAVSKG